MNGGGPGEREGGEGTGSGGQKGRERGNRKIKRRGDAEGRGGKGWILKSEIE